MRLSAAAAAAAALLIAAAAASAPPPVAALTKTESLPFTIHPNAPGSVEVALDTPPIPASTCAFAYATVGATPEAWEAVVEGDGDTNRVTCTVRRAGGGSTYLMFTSWEVRLGGDGALLDATVRDGGGRPCRQTASTRSCRGGSAPSTGGGGGGGGDCGGVDAAAVRGSARCGWGGGGGGGEEARGCRGWTPVFAAHPRIRAQGAGGKKRERDVASGRWGTRHSRGARDRATRIDGRKP
ncbi:hypothetical protein BU14_0091s0004 [Porphyra umbilicalis]|uniref:Uncharacterized protein n=1 Tax=Porphyra umbilicalis TaxID=2786 RepID=A0A1X6PE79_PORUM|nr:hypothetical protein BU14_0091s0004 [Porphyra umbilicalis]|eukprot:OSX79025.1 hypothetical protein BU14_0091s0004 [Porphyra umbilicalis]